MPKWPAACRRKTGGDENPRTDHRFVATRLEIAAPDREGQRRAQAIMAMPQNVAAAARIGWRSADRMWRLRAIWRPISTIIPSA
jgi:hypothetical protein